MASKMTLCLVLLLSIGPEISAQSLQQLQAVVDGITSPTAADEANVVLREIPGVVMSRLDHNTSNLLMHVAPGAQVDADMLRGALAPFGFTLRCFQRSAAGASPFRHIDAGSCNEQPVPVR